jgi:hypothetical protein
VPFQLHSQGHSPSHPLIVRVHIRVARGQIRVTLFGLCLPPHTHLSASQGIVIVPYYLFLSITPPLLNNTHAATSKGFFDDSLQSWQCCCALAAVTLDSTVASFLSLFPSLPLSLSLSPFLSLSLSLLLAIPLSLSLSLSLSRSPSLYLTPQTDFPESGCCMPCTVATLICHYYRKCVDAHTELIPEQPQFLYPHCGCCCTELWLALSSPHMFSHQMSNTHANRVEGYTRKTFFFLFSFLLNVFQKPEYVDQKHDLLNVVFRPSDNT